MIFLKMDPDKFSNYNSIDVLGIFLFMKFLDQLTDKNACHLM